MSADGWIEDSMAMGGDMALDSSSIRQWYRIVNPSKNTYSMNCKWKVKIKYDEVFKIKWVIFSSATEILTRLNDNKVKFLTDRRTARQGRMSVVVDNNK
jgi:hypothetical protein